MNKRGNKVTNPKNVTIREAKGRPMLQWVDKHPLNQIIALPAYEIESFSPVKNYSPLRKNEKWSIDYPATGLLFHGDNKEVLAHLLANGFRGKVNLIYIDPPFDSGADYVRKIKLRGISGTFTLEGEEYTLGEQIQYADIWANDNYLQFIYERLLLLKELLSEDGNIFIQADDKRGHYIKLLLDEVMGVDNYINDIVWHKGREGGGGTEVNPSLPTEYQNIYLYAKNKKERKWHPPKGPYRLSTVNNIQSDEKGWFYTRGRMGRKPAPWEIKAGVSKKTYVSNDPSEPREKVIERITSPGAKYVLIGDIWNSDLIKNSTETDYPTEKPESLLQLIVEASTDPNDIVLDCFVGGGTTAVVAQKLGRCWIACDLNKGSIQTTSKRLQEVIEAQVKIQKEIKSHPIPFGVKKEDNLPAQLSFNIYKVNDYDLQLQHNEALNLAFDTLGITPTNSDPFFEGGLGNKLVKVIPFNHPLSPLDLESIKETLSTRPDEDRDIVVVCLGKELSSEKWIEDWNVLRKNGNVPNKFEVIELRNDPKVGNFFLHKPASARLQLIREKNKVIIKIDDYISPTVIDRLKQQSGIVTPYVDDWRSTVDAIEIDTNYNGKVFNIVHSDIPSGKKELVLGSYILPAPSEKKIVIAVKIIDVLGEEVVVIKELE